MRSQREAVNINVDKVMSKNNGLSKELGRENVLTAVLGKSQAVSIAGSDVASLRQTIARIEAERGFLNVLETTASEIEQFMEAHGVIFQMAAGRVIVSAPAVVLADQRVA